jgi:hypothetical protein
MGSHPYEGIPIKIDLHLLKGIASKGLNYEIIVMIILLIFHNSNKITLSYSTQCGYYMGKFGRQLFMGQMWILPLEAINCGY